MNAAVNATVNANVIDAILVLVGLEALALLLYRRSRQRGMRTSEVISFLGAGTGLLLAMRVLATGGAYLHFALAMLFSLIMHAWHVRQRWV